MIIKKKTRDALIDAMMQARIYDVSHPFWDTWRDPAIDQGMPYIARVEFVAKDLAGNVAVLPWKLTDPLTVLKAMVKGDGETAVTIIASTADGLENIASCSATAVVSMEMLATHAERIGDIVDMLVRKTLRMAVKGHPAAERFLSEVAERFHWDAARLDAAEGALAGVKAPDIADDGGGIPEPEPVMEAV